ncbi:DUF3793 family protein [uncultured Clostridium sp.]|uniref:DUF3793 family protein n=1 Tax=uncultured Clostridium sp. TaxID=59620 RepID=UPI00262B47EA|nr:DUF3793 family protein [uncultured Clostridium sp.]
MGILEFYKNLSSMSSKEYIEKFLLYNTSLVISGVKPSETVTLKKTGENAYEKWIEYGESYLKAVGMEYISLRENKDALIILVYNREVLSRRLFEEKSKEFLMNLDYPKEENLDFYLKMLVKRYEAYNCPHELGLFLGIPIEDVKDFMECTDKKCLHCGYWKVYNNYAKAKETFEKYDNIKEKTVQHILNGTCPYNLALSIKVYA